MNKQIPITIIGLGQVGKAFLRVLSQKGYRVVSAFNRSPIADSLKKDFPQTRFKKGLPGVDDPIGRFTFLTVSDDAVNEISDRLSNIISQLNIEYIVHCSGTLTSGSLTSLKSKGVKTASFHPIKSITSSTSTFENCWFDMEGDEELLVKLKELAESFGANSFRVEQEAKPLLHASAVVASNYLVVLADLFTRISAMGNIPEKTAIQALSPLMENTLHNIQELGVKDALTGPIARGDVSTIKEHMEKLESDPEVLELYKVLGTQAADIAGRRSENPEKLEQINKLLS